MSTTELLAPPTEAERSLLYRSIAETIPHMVWTARADGWLDFFNARACEYTGMSSTQLEGWGWKPVIHPQDWDACLARWTRSLQSGEPYEIEYRLRRHDGAYLWHLGAARPLRDAGGEITKWFGTCTDIEDQKRSAALLARSNEALQALVAERTRAHRASEERLRQIIENEPECVKLLDAKGRLLEMNAAGLRMIEADDLSAVLGQCVYPQVAPEHRDAFRDLTERVCRGDRGTLQFEIVGLKGTRRWLETHAAPFHDEQRGEHCLLGISRDITDRVRAEGALRASEQRFQSFMDNLPAAAWIKDSRLRLKWVNPRDARLQRRAFDEILGRDDFELHPPEVARLLRAQDEEVLRARRPVQYLNVFPVTDGTEHTFLVVKFPLPDTEGKPGVAGIAIDVTERHQLEQAVRQLLNRLVRAQEAERRSVAADLHDLIGQKLTALGLALDIVRQGLPAAVREPLAPRLRQMSTLVEETIASIRDVMSELRPPMLDDHGLVPVLHWYASLFESRTGLKVRVSGLESGPRLHHEIEMALFRIAQEALTNAAKHSGATEVRVRVEQREDSVCMRIEDDGRGLSDSAIGRAFAPGGWGLPAMRERAQALGGDLRVERGSPGVAVIVEVPVVRADQRHPG